MKTGHCSQGMHDQCPAPIACKCVCHPERVDPPMRAGAVLPSCVDFVAPDLFTHHALVPRPERERARPKPRTRAPFVARRPKRPPFPTEVGADLAEWVNA